MTFLEAVNNSLTTRQWSKFTANLHNKWVKDATGAHEVLWWKPTILIRRGDILTTTVFTVKCISPDHPELVPVRYLGGCSGALPWGPGVVLSPPGEVYVVTDE